MMNVVNVILTPPMIVFRIVPDTGEAQLNSMNVASVMALVPYMIAIVKMSLKEPVTVSEMY